MKLVPYNKSCSMINIFAQNDNICDDDKITLHSYMKELKIYEDDNGKKYYHLKTAAGLFNVKHKKIEFDEPEEMFRAVIVLNDRKIRAKLLTREGLYRLTYQADNNMGKLFRRCISFILDTLLLQGEVQISDIEKFVEDKHSALYASVIRDFKKKI